MQLNHSEFEMKMGSFKSLFLVICLIEAILKVLIDYLSSQFPWILTKKSEFPLIESEVLTKYGRKSHHAMLGWVRKTNSCGNEKLGNHITQYSINESGSRTICNPHDRILISTFGDSYAFCRQVNDNETWQYFLGKMLDVGVNNFGVGNYGLDQALLRYELIQELDQTDVVILCVVPETIARIQSVWKHYFEHGNTLAFKPRFKLIDGELLFTPNYLNNPNMYYGLKSKKLRKTLQSSDLFYKAKFRKYQFRFPYTFYLLLHPIRQFRLLARVLGQIWSSKENDVKQRFTNAWHQIKSENINISQNLYADKSSTDLLTHLLMRFNQIAKGRSHIPLIVVIPQLADLLTRPLQRNCYQQYFEERSKEMNVLDLSKQIEQNLHEPIYGEEINGGHLTTEGNQLVAKLIYEKIVRIRMLREL